MGKFIVPATVVAVVILASLFLARQSDSQARAPRVVTAASGRYQLMQISDFRRDQFMVDTQTGRVWTTVLTRDSVVVFEAVPYEGAGPNARYSILPQ